MNAQQLREIVNDMSGIRHKSTKDSIRRRLETAAVNGCYEMTFNSTSYDGPFLLPESDRKAFLEDLTKDGFEVKCETRWWKRKTITISWENS